MGYAIWLIPSSTEFTVLSELMKFRPQSSTLDSRSRSYPSFDPHITLATFDELPPLFNLDAISLDNLPLPVGHFRSVTHGDSYLGALSIVVSPAKNMTPLRDAVTARLDRLNIQWKSRNFPHMSLFYVDEPFERGRLYAELTNCGRIQGDKDLTLTANPSMQVKTFTGSEIRLVDCTRSVKRWYPMKTRSLVPPAPPPPPKETVPQKRTDKGIHARPCKRSQSEDPAASPEPQRSRRHTTYNREYVSLVSSTMCSDIVYTRGCLAQPTFLTYD
ncbi:hypothetical protein IW261DRAFT_1156448 [Armillaria novae-zelandiae]|uniref:2',3'-cyclic-nucleotide 3'-phosphodiesterase n=1 Tax=Armillaria novae-zelandiae TaxID=153914 RepID=A0AA39NHF8_9AGAR|nr:hypothetical protein IW261DRAFT_1156448 [Armillaria novae-zelandiae]